MSTEQKPKLKKINKKSFCIATLRRASYRWPARNEAAKKARIGRNQYICALCGPKVVFPKKGIQIDHKDPVIKLTGWESFDSFIERLLCEEDGFQIICKAHHEEKTKKEKELRKHYRNLVKDLEKNEY